MDQKVQMEISVDQFLSLLEKNGEGQGCIVWSGENHDEPRLLRAIGSADFTNLIIGFNTAPKGGSIKDVRIHLLRVEKSFLLIKKSERNDGVFFMEVPHFPPAPANSLEGLIQGLELIKKYHSAPSSIASWTAGGESCTLRVSPYTGDLMTEDERAYLKGLGWEKAEESSDNSPFAEDLTKKSEISYWELA